MKYPNSPFSPEVCWLIALVNVATTTDGLTDLFWTALFEIECEDLDRERVQPTESSLENCQRLHNVEAAIITIISKAGRDVLEDDPTVDTLEAIQRTPAVIEAVNGRSSCSKKASALFLSALRCSTAAS
jgi:hypothetical protein